MNNYLKKIKSVLYLLLWLFLVLAGWFFWIFFLGLDIWSYALPLILGLGVGVLSGLTPARTFLVSFLGFFILGILYNTLFPHVILGLTLFGILCGLFAVAGANTTKDDFKKENRRNLFIRVSISYCDEDGSNCYYDDSRTSLVGCSKIRFFEEKSYGSSSRDVNRHYVRECSKADVLWPFCDPINLSHSSTDKHENIRRLESWNSTARYLR
jgi:hypothetical protein